MCDGDYISPQKGVSLCLYIPFPNSTTSKDKSYSYSDVKIGIPHSLEPFSSRLVH